MEIIDWVKHEEKGNWSRPNLVSYVLIEAMSAKAGTEVEQVFKPFNPQALQVEFKVNGVELSFLDVMQRIHGSLSNLEDECKKTVYKEVCEKVVNELNFKLYELDH